MDSRSKALILLDDVIGYTLGTGATLSSLMELTEFHDSFVTHTYGPETDYAGLNATVTDTGRQITVYDAGIIGSPHVAIFREVLYYDSGSSSTISFYICTQILDYSRDIGFSQAKVARSG